MQAGQETERQQRGSQARHWGSRQAIRVEDRKAVASSRQDRKNERASRTGVRRQKTTNRPGLGMEPVSIQVARRQIQKEEEGSQHDILEGRLHAFLGYLQQAHLIITDICKTIGKKAGRLATSHRYRLKRLPSPWLRIRSDPALFAEGKT